MNDPFIEYYCSSSTGLFKTNAFSLTTTAKRFTDKKSPKIILKTKKETDILRCYKGYDIFDKFANVGSFWSLSYSFTILSKVSLAKEKQTNKGIVLSLWSKTKKKFKTVSWGWIRHKYSRASSS